jgi:hypothetical protein
MVAWVRIALACVATFVAVGDAGHFVVDGSGENPSVAPINCRSRDTCCKVCRKGKACGNTCIRRDYDCHVGRGCACNSDEICED